MRFGLGVKFVGMVLLCVAAICGASWAVLQYVAGKASRATAEQSLRFTRSAFESLEHDDGDRLAAVMEPLLDDPVLARLFRARDREGLTAAASPLFARLRQAYGITHWYFIEPEPSQKCFLRVHVPGKYGDKIERLTMKGAMASHAQSEGKELGKTGFALRVVRPWVVGGELLGYMEMGEEIDHFVMAVQKHTGDQLAMAVEKRFIDKDGWAAILHGRRNGWDDLQNVLVVSATDGFTAGMVEDLPQLSGISDAGEVRGELNQGGRKLVRSAFPVRDAAGQKVGAVFVLHDITDLERSLVAGRSAGIAIAFVLTALSGLVAWLMSRRITAQLRQLNVAANRVALGELDVGLSVSSKDEVGELATSFGGMAGSLKIMLAGLRSASEELAAASARMQQTAAEQAAAGSQLSSAMHETSAAVAQISATTREAADRANGVVTATQRSEELSRSGQQAVAGVNRGMEALSGRVTDIAGAIGSLSERALEIGQLISTVQEVAEQSHVLALNAAIEAAQAGEAGRGFSVVAREMRTLAEGSKGAVDRVRRLLADVEKTSHAAVESAERGKRQAQEVEEQARNAGKAIDGLGEVILQSTSAALGISQSATAQTAGVDQILDAVKDGSAVAERAQQRNREVEQASVELSTMSQRLAGLVASYKV